MNTKELTELFISWNKALFSYFFDENTEEDEVSLYIDREKLEEVGSANGLGGYDEFMSLIMLSIDERKALYDTLRQQFIRTSRPQSLNSIYKSTNLFDFATIFIDEGFYNYIDCPFLIYIVFAIVMASECSRENRRGLGKYITEQLKTHFPDHTDRREALEDLFNELATRHPRFCARKLTKHPYVGLIYYQLGLTKSQVNILEKAMYNADLSEELPYDQWIDKLVDYVDQDTKPFLRNSKSNEIKRRRISDLREKFDPTLYEQKHQNEEIQSKGHFVLAVYEDEYSEAEDRLVLLTDINNKTISHDNLKITKGKLDRLGDYAEYNVNHVLDEAQMRTYSIRNGENRITSIPLGNIVTFTRCSNNYLIQTNYPQNGKETYILVKNGHEDEWEQWLVQQGSPKVEAEKNTERVLHIFGRGWNMYISNEIKYVGRQASCHVSAPTKGGGINCPGKTNVYLITALPYIEFPEPIDHNELKINIKVDQIPVNLKKDQFSYKIIDSNKLVIDLIGIKPSNRSFSVKVSIIYKGCPHQEVFDVTGQKVKYNDDDLFNVNMWGSVSTDVNAPYMKGLNVYNVEEPIDMPEGTGLYQNTEVDLDIHDKKFYLVNLFTAECSMRKGFSITESRLKKCIRYAATRFNINIASDPTFYTDVKDLLLNSGYMNADYENGKYQPIPPTFIKTAVGLGVSWNLFMLVGSYTQKFLCDLKEYCENKSVSIYLHTNNNESSKSEDLIPPVILLGNRFNPDDFANSTQSQCSYHANEDLAVNLLRALPSYVEYDRTLEYVAPTVFSTTLEDPDSQDFPRIRASKATGYSSSKWIEKKENDFHRITIPDVAWANLYCQYKKQKIICTKDIDKLLFPAKLHLPVMMQRALYILNFGVPKTEKSFICRNDDRKDVYYNVIKRYKINDTNRLTRLSPVIRSITGRPDDSHNPSVRSRFISYRFKMFIWKNRNKASRNPRSLLVLTDINQQYVYGLGIKKISAFAVYLRDYTNDDYFRLVDNDDVSYVFSKIISSNWANERLKCILMNRIKTFQEIGVAFDSDRCMALPPREEYDIEEIQII